MNDVKALTTDEKRKARKWTPSQSAAIEFDGDGLLLSAGAGSGKTATLTEKVSRLVCDEENGVPIREMLIVTFTRAAAGELRERIGKRLREKLLEDPASHYLARQLAELESADISTISSFFYNAVKPYFSSLGLPPSFKVEDESSMSLLKERVMADALDLFFDMRDADFTKLADALGSARDENFINKKLLQIADAMTKKGYGAEQMARWASELENYAGKDFFDSPHGAELHKLTLEFAEHYMKVYSYHAENLAFEEKAMAAYGANLKNVTEFLSRLTFLLEKGSYADVREHITSFSPPALKANREKSAASEKFKSAKGSFDADFKKLKPRYASPEKSVRAAMSESAVLSRAVAKVLSRYFADFEEEKKERGVVDFGDLEVYAKRVFCNEDLSPTPAAFDFAKRYKYIFVDEYQDTNKIQDAVFSALGAAVKRFMVGDVKQSIYAFRGAEPSVFTNYRKIWKPLSAAETSDKKDGNVSVFMNENFRSDSTVIDFVNIVSEYMFCGTSTPFEAGDRLVYGGSRPDGYIPDKAEVCLISKKDKSEEDADEKKGDAEIDFVVSRISHMLKSETLPSGKKITPSDIAVLTRGKADCTAVAKALKSIGVPAADRAASEFFEQREILLVLCILNVIDNPLRDIYLAGAMKSPVFGFSMEEMIAVLEKREKNSDTPLWYCVTEYAESGRNEALRLKCREFCDTVSKFRISAPGMSASKLLSFVYDTLSLYSLAKDTSAGSSVRKNLTRLYELARSFEDDTFGGLYGFICYINELIEGAPVQKDDAVSENSVSVMTIHKSKGLEFPVCFVCRCSKKFNVSDASEDVLFDTETGLAMRLKDESGLVKCETPLREAIEEKMRYQNVCEEARILYVAMTRAVSKLIITMTVTDADKALQKALEKYDFDSPFVKRNASSYADFILPAAVGKAGCDCFEIKKISPGGLAEQQDEKEDFAKSEDFEEGTSAEAERLSGLYLDRMSFDYSLTHETNLPAKLTVSKLTPSLLDDEDDEYFALFESFSETGTKDEKEEIKKVPVPRFLSEEKSAKGTDVGTSTHVFLQFADFKRLSELGFDAELQRLLDKKFITPKMASLVNKKEIEAFCKSELMSSVLASTEVYREFRFNTALPAADFTKDAALSAKLSAEGRNIIVQGVIDLVFRNAHGEIILVDYKTDRLSFAERSDRELARKTLRQRHSMQLGYYRAALEKMFCEEISRTVIYSLALGEAVEVKR